MARILTITLFLLIAGFTINLVIYLQQRSVAKYFVPFEIPEYVMNRRPIVESSRDKKGNDCTKDPSHKPIAFPSPTGFQTTNPSKTPMIRKVQAPTISKRRKNIVKIEAVMQKSAFWKNSTLFKEDSHMQVEMPCHINSVPGIGNILTRLFAMRVVAMVTNSTFSFQCKEGNLLQPFEVNNTEPEDISRLIYPAGKVSDEEILTNCQNMYPHTQKNCAELLSDFILKDLRRIAESFSDQLDRDDIVIHLRCGDVLGLPPGGYGLLPHSYYLDRIENVPAGTHRTIAIITQPFDPKNGREEDMKENRYRICRKIVENTVKVLQKKDPQATVKIHNTDPTPLHSLLRMVLAKEAVFCGPSTFCSAATLATMAEKGYVYHTPWGDDPAEMHNWLLPLAKHGVYKHFEVVEGPVLRGEKGVKLVDKMSLENIIRWMSGEKPVEESSDDEED